jgi:chloramphenicol-sensitive protein RarD
MLRGFYFALVAYIIWGFIPTYFKLVEFVGTVELLIHRILWAALFLLGVVLVGKHLPAVMEAVKNKKVLFWLFVSGTVYGANLLAFMWAVNHDRMLEASLGYYINPLCNVVLGYVILKERFRFLQKVAVGLAFVSVTFLLVMVNSEIPWISFFLAIGFSIYGLVRKQVQVEAISGLFIETLLLVPLAVIFYITTDNLQISYDITHLNLVYLMMGLGIISTIPLILFNIATRLIRYSTIGFIQYIEPTIVFFLAVYFFNEPLTETRLITFICIWIALALFCYDGYRHEKIKHSQSKCII